jgi:hypothetical protein
VTGRGSFTVRRFGLILALTLGGVGGLLGPGPVWAQTPSPSTPSDPTQQPPGQPPQGQQPQEQAPQQPASPTPEPGLLTPTEQRQLLQQYQQQQPLGPPVTPATPPSTTLPPWTPPVPPAPSQTNVPAPFPGFGRPGYVGAPGLTMPGLLPPTVTTIRGATLEFHPTARLAEEYSDNFFQTSSHAEDNFRTILGPGFTLFLNGARTFGALSTTIDLVHDTAPNTGNEVKVFPSLNLAVRYALSPRLALTLTDTFVRSDEANTLDRLGIRQGRQISDSNTLGLTVDWLVGRIATQAYYRNVLFINEEHDNFGTPGTQNNRGDSITNIVGVNASTRIATDYLVRAGYEFSAINELNESNNTNNNNINDNISNTVFASGSRQFGLYTTGGISSSYSWQTEDSTNIWNISLFGAYGLPSGLSLAASVGYSILNSDTQDNEGLISANVNASYRFTRAVISVGVFQDFRQTGQQGENFGTVETRTYYGQFLYQITPFLNAVANVAYSENEPTGTGNVNNNGTEKSLTYGAGINWQALRWLTASLRYAYTKQTGRNAFNQDVAGTGNYAENRFMLNLFAAF